MDYRRIYIGDKDNNLIIEIDGIKEIGKALNRIADELEKANNYNGKHQKGDNNIE